MIENKLRKLLPSEAITDKLDKIIDAFVVYYGEDKREEITNRFRSILILKFSNLQSLKEIINDVKTSILKEIYEIPDKEYVHLDVDDFYNRFKSGNIKYMYISSKTMEIITGNKSIKVEELYENYKNGLYPKLEDFFKKYESIKEQLAQYEERIKIEEQREEEIRKKYYRMLFDEFKYLFSEDEIKFYENDELFLATKIRQYISDRLHQNGHCFDEESERILNDPNEKEWKKESIISDRETFLKTIYGSKFETGDKLNSPTYEDYLKDPKCREFIKETIEICTKISKRTKELYNQMTNEIIESSLDYQECRKKVDERNLVNKNDTLGPFVYTSPVSCFEENYIKTEQGYELSPLILINSGTTDLDCTIIHELNHAYEHCTLSVDEKGSASITGWDFDTLLFSDKKNNEDSRYDGISRKYELMSEYINDRIAQEITDIMHNRGDFIFSPTRNNNTSSYLIVRFLLEEFFQEFKDIIIKSRSHNNINYLFENLGRENFEELNSLVIEFYDNFGFSYSAYGYIADYAEKKETKEALEIGSLIERRNNILDRMRERKASHTL